MSETRLVWDEAAWQRVRRALALGVLNGAHAIEGEAKAITPVHGDPSQGGQFKTFAPGVRPIGGTLRRSITSAVYVDGQLIRFSETSDPGAPRLSESPGDGIEGKVGSALEYAAWVHDGTKKMPARPYLATARLQVAPRLRDLVEAGYRRAMSTGGR